MEHVINGIRFGIAAFFAIWLLGVVAGFVKTVQVRANIMSTHFFNRRGKGAKAFIILSGTPNAVNSAAEVVVQVLNEAEQASVQNAEMGIGVNDNTSTQNPGVPTENQR